MAFQSVNEAVSNSLQVTAPNTLPADNMGPQNVVTIGNMNYTPDQLKKFFADVGNDPTKIVQAAVNVGATPDQLAAALTAGGVGNYNGDQVRQIFATSMPNYKVDATTGKIGAAPSTTPQTTPGLTPRRQRQQDQFGTLSVQQALNRRTSNPREPSRVPRSGATGLPIGVAPAAPTAPTQPTAPAQPAGGIAAQQPAQTGPIATGDALAQQRDAMHSAYRSWQDRAAGWMKKTTAPTV